MKIKNFHKLYISILAIMIIAVINFVSPSHKCGVWRAEMNFIKTGSINEGRSLQSAQWVPIRIYVDYTMLHEQNLNKDWLKHFKTMMSKTVSMYEGLIKVRPLKE